MEAGIFSPDGNNFCQLVTPNDPKPMFLAHFHPGAGGASLVQAEPRAWPRLSPEGRLGGRGGGGNKYLSRPTETFHGKL